MTVAVPEAAAALQPSLQRRRLLRLIAVGGLALPALALAACGTRKDLPEERRTRGKYGRGDGGKDGG